MRVKSACELSVPLSKSGDKEDGNETIGSRRAREKARKSSSRSKEKQQQKGSSSRRSADESVLHASQVCMRVKSACESSLHASQV